jgi:alkanesulfonate monooxygenase SsuD/methylene tetrahydromethanopterin reductase-like flavin-dependent oxidoreductase (luciferase family)
MADVPRRYGVTVPIPGVPLHAHREWFEEIAALGFSDVWSSEADGPDGFTPLALATAWVPTLRGGIAIVPAFTRGPALLAQSAATMADAAPGRFALGIGASSPAIVERWNGIPFVDPFRRTRDTVRFLRRALTGEKVS